MAAPASFSSAEISDVITTTMHNRSGTVADNVTDNNALLFTLKKKNKIKTFSGGDVILQELNYEDANTNNASSYSGYETLNITPNSPITAARFDIKQYAAAVSCSGLEMLQNAGKEKIIDLIESRMEIAEGQLMNLISADVYGDGTGNGGKAMTGCQAIIADSPATGTVGGIDRATWSFWRNTSYDSTTDGGAAATSANIQSYMNATALQIVRGVDSADLIVADNNYYKLYLESLQTIQRITSETMGAAGFSAIKYYGTGKAVDVVLDGGVGGNCPTNHMYFINSKYMFYRPHADRNFVPIGGDRMAVNQDAVVKLLGWAGNVTVSGARFLAVLKD